MKLGEDIDLDELLLNPILFVVFLASFQFLRGESHFGVSEYKKTRVWELTFEYHYNTFRNLTEYIMA